RPYSIVAGIGHRPSKNKTKISSFTNVKRRIIGMFSYTSFLATEYRQDLEQLLFFNTAQHVAHSAIEDSIEMFGEPFVDNDGKRLRVNVRKLDEVQTLFTLDGNKLVGVLLYSRVSYETVVVIHIAVHEDYSSRGHLAHRKLVLQMSQQLRKCVRKIKGIEFMRMMYGNNRTKDYPVRRRNSCRSRQPPGLSKSTLGV
ncbi:hypothetical protein N8198_10855, partial [Gammaproteobacteria bacterium]|nr:hypothetical protein [Gammaproteobacteria bacterium]